MNIPKYIAYYRVSTKQQGRSGLGLEAQRTMVKQFVKCDDCIIAEYTDVESGKKNTRPELLKAIQHSKDTGAKLVIAKLDRLSRNAGFIYMLRDTKVEFVCADMPDANSLTIGIFAALAQHEREIISERTKAALAAKKATGWQPGSPENLTDDARQKAIEVRKENARAANSEHALTIKYMRNADVSFRDIASQLNQSGKRTRTGKEFKAMTVKRIYDRYAG